MPLEKIEALSEDWPERLRQCQYVGELVIEEDELQGLARKIRPDLLSGCCSNLTKTIMLVIAINCMYYNHDEQGFWVHFSRLMEVDNSSQNNQWLGNMIESQLLNFHFIPERRSGPFRYVTPIREQCGITRSEIPRFAGLLRSMGEGFGWDGIRVLNQTELSKVVSGFLQSGHLEKFLTSKQGCAFVRDVARNVSQLHRGILTNDDLQTLTGYRTGFFKEFFQELGREITTPTQSVANYPVPCLMFSEEFRNVGLYFEQSGITRGAFKFNGEIVRQNPIPLESDLDYRTAITGERKDYSGRWSKWDILGWDPTKSKVALFHSTKGYTDHTKGVQPGEYFMIGPYQAPPPDEVRRGDLGMVDLPFSNLELDAWWIVITENSDLSFLGLDGSMSALPTDLITWSDTDSKVPGTLGRVMVFTPTTPPLIVSRSEYFTSGKVALLFDDGRGPRPLRVPPGRNTVNLDVAAPAQGRVWVEPISRLREFSDKDVLCELEFCLIPECHIQWPSGLYAFEEQPEVVFETQRTGISLELENAKQLDESGRRWRIESHATVVHGQIRCSDFAIPIAKRVYRAFLRDRQYCPVEYLLREHLQNSETLILSGIPNEYAILEIMSDHSISQSLGTLGNFNDAGECRFPTTGIRDSLLSCQTPVGLLAVGHQGSIVPTNALYIDCNQLIEWISATDDEVIPSWAEIMHGPVRQAFDIARCIRATPPREVAQIEKLYTMPEALRSFFQDVRVCAVVFDEALLAEKPNLTPDEVVLAHSEDSADVSNLLIWYLKARDFVLADEGVVTPSSEGLLTEHEGLSWTPPFPRWVKILEETFAKVEETFAQIKAENEAVPLIEEWKRDVEGGYRTVYPSRIASKQGGRELTEAWIQYACYGKYQPAINEATKLIQWTGSPVSELAGILLVVCYMRKAVFDSQPPIQPQSTNHKLGAALDGMKGLAMLGKSECVVKRPPLNDIMPFIPFLPFRPEDEKMIASVGEGWETDANVNDWLTCYHYARLRECGLLAQTSPKLLQLSDILERVPPSPERSRIIDILERQLND